MWKIFYRTCLALLLLALLWQWQLVYFMPKLQVKPSKVLEAWSLPPAQAEWRLSAAIRQMTLSDYPDVQKKFVDFLAQTYPTWHKQSLVHRFELENNTWLYHWQGRNPQLKPILLGFQLDPREPSEAELLRWTYHPFGGMVEGGFVWGCGSLQDKSALMAVFEALDSLAKGDFQPERSFYLALLGDGQAQQQSQSLAILRSQLESAGLQFDLVLYPELGLIQDYLEPQGQTMALVGRACGLYFPPSVARPSPVAVEDKIGWRDFLRHYSPQQDFWTRYQLRFGNYWGGGAETWFKTNWPWCAQIFLDEKDSLGAYYLSYQTNLPEPWQQSPEWQNGGVIGYPAFSPLEGFGWDFLQNLIQQVYPQTWILPFESGRPSVWASLRSSHGAVFGFAPWFYGGQDWGRFAQGQDERIGLNNYTKMIQFYYQLIEQACGI